MNIALDKLRYTKLAELSAQHDRVVHQLASINTLRMSVVVVDNDGNFTWAHEAGLFCTPMDAETAARETARRSLEASLDMLEQEIKSYQDPSRFVARPTATENIIMGLSDVRSEADAQ